MKVTLKKNNQILIDEIKSTFKMVLRIENIEYSLQPLLELNNSFTEFSIKKLGFNQLKILNKSDPYKMVS